MAVMWLQLITAGRYKMTYSASLLELVDTFIHQGYTQQQALAIAKQLDKAANAEAEGAK